jgi:MscS family membrane protein
MMKHFLLSLFLALAFLQPTHAYATAAIVKTEEKATDEEKAPPIDQWGRSTPRGMVEGFLNSIGQEDYEKASQYLNLSDFSERERKTKGADLAKNLQTLLDRGGWFFPSAMLSNAREGKLADETPAEEDQRDVIGNLRGNGNTIEIVAEISKDEQGNPIWLISKDTVEALPGLIGTGAASEPFINKLLPDALVDLKWGGAPAGHWLAMIILLALSYGAAWFIILGLVKLGKKYWTRRATVNGHHILDAVRVPASLYLAVWIFGLSSLWLGVSIIVRQHIGQLNVIVAWTAIALLAWRLIDIFAEATQRKIGTNGRYYGFSSILYFFRRIIKVVFGIVVAFILLDNLGVDVTAGLAALGIGGIALALGAQKTLENFIGSLAIVIDQPVHIGDYCKIGGVAGTVEDIGMRSTRLRTNDRTLVTIPNGDLSNQTIENFARRSRFLVNKKFQLRYDATAGDILAFTRKYQEILFANDNVTEEGFPVRYLGPGPDGHQIELFFYINVSDNNEYLKIQQDLMLQMTDLVDTMGLFYIIPSQTMLPAVDQRGADSGVHAAAQSIVKQTAAES